MNSLIILIRIKEIEEMIRSNRSSKWRAESIVAEIQSILWTFCDYMHALGGLHWMPFVEFIDSLFVIVFFERG